MPQASCEVVGAVLETPSFPFWTHSSAPAWPYWCCAVEGVAFCKTDMSQLVCALLWYGLWAMYLLL